MSLNYLRPPIIAAVCLLLIYSSHAYQTPQHHATGGFTQPEPIDFNDHQGWTQIFDGKINIVKYAGYWLRDESGKPSKKFTHICWDGCMFPNETLMNPKTWNDILGTLINVRNAHGWD